MQKPKVVFFGSSKFVIPIIEVLQKNFDLSLVVTTEKLPTDPVPVYCNRSKLHYYTVLEYRKQREEIVKRIQSTKATLGVLASFGAILPSGILGLFPKGIINIHPSLLPKYRGPTPVQTAILNGDKTTGVTIIKLDEDVDHGQILSQQRVDILPNDTTEYLQQRLFKLGSSLIVQTIELYLRGKTVPQEQNHSEATLTKRLSRQDGFIDIKNPPKTEMLNRMIRAYYPWPGVWSKFRIQNSEFRIKFLSERKIQVEGKKPMSYKNFENGYGSKGKELLEKLQLT